MSRILARTFAVLLLATNLTVSGVVQNQVRHITPEEYEAAVLRLSGVLTTFTCSL